MKRDFAGKAICLVVFVAILVVGAYGFSGKLLEERKQTTTETPATTVTEQQEKTEAPTETKPTETTTEKGTSKGTSKRTSKGKPKSTDKLVALTFDDGPYSPVTSKILDTLKKYNGRATFFVVGNRAADYSKVLKRASDMGCEIGSHTYSHVNLTTLSVSEMQTEVQKSCNAISDITGKKVTIMRPPEGATSDSVKANIGMPMVMWSVDSRDWDYRNADKDYQTVMDNVFDGSIVLMHDLYPETAEAVAKIVPELAKQGYKFVTFSELMELRGVEVEAGCKYFSAQPQTPADEEAE